MCNVQSCLDAGGGRHVGGCTNTFHTSAIKSIDNLLRLDVEAALLHLIATHTQRFSPHILSW